MQVQKSSDGSHIPADSQPSLCLKQNRLLKDWSRGIKKKTRYRDVFLTVDHCTFISCCVMYETLQKSRGVRITVKQV